MKNVTEHCWKKSDIVFQNGNFPMVFYFFQVATLDIVTWEVAIGKMPFGKYFTLITDFDWK